MAQVNEVDPTSDLTIRTINDIFELVSARGDKPAIQWQDGSEWKPITAAEVYGRVRALAAAFTAWGVKKGDRIAILSENRWEWAVTDFAALALGAIDVPLYATTPADQVGYMLRDSGAKIIVVSTKDQYEKVAAAGDLPAAEHVLVMDAGEYAHAHSFGEVLKQHALAPGMRDADFDAQVASVQPDDVATIIYTSGTTGTPKGAMLTHGNLASNVCVSATPYGFNATDVSISFLPLSHVTARHVDYSLMARGSLVAYLPKFDRLPAAMKALKPTVFVAVPRVYEKIRQTIEGRAAESPVKRAILVWAFEIGKRHRPATLAGRPQQGLQWSIAKRLVFGKIHEAFGGRVKVFIAGGAPLGPETAGWFADAGIRLFEGYGMTETSPVISANQPSKHRLGTVGPLLKNIEVRFAEDGELEVKGPSVFIGYWNQEEETRKSFTEDGFFKTGDIAKLEDGFLSITDRKKELLKTSGGKLIAPQPIENKLKANSLVAQAALVGDKHKFAAVLISPNFEALDTWAKQQGLDASNRAALVEDAKVKAEYKRIVDGVNAKLAHFESIKRIRVVPDEWAIETGELTPSMKLKRRVIEKKYEAQIADFYKDEATVQG